MVEMFNRKSLYVVALLLIFFTEVWLFYIFSRFILAGEGVGIYGVFVYFCALMASVILWGVSYRQNRSKIKTLLFWLVALAILPIILTQPVWWSAPAI